MKKLKIIQQEKPSLGTLFLRKSSRSRVIETGVFIFLIFVIYQYTGYNTAFKLIAIGTALLTISLSPVIYKLINKPEYILTETELIIKTGHKEEKIPLIFIENSYDLRYFYYIKGKKFVIATSNNFLEALDQQLLLIKKHQKKKV